MVTDAINACKEELPSKHDKCVEEKLFKNIKNVEDDDIEDLKECLTDTWLTQYKKIKKCISNRKEKRKKEKEQIKKREKWEKEVRKAEDRYTKTGKRNWLRH